jgi:hypothetical protein
MEILLKTVKIYQKYNSRSPLHTAHTSEKTHFPPQTIFDVAKMHK